MPNEIEAALRGVGEDVEQLDANVRELHAALAEITDLTPTGVTRSFAGLTLDALLRALTERSGPIMHERSRIVAGEEDASPACVKLYGRAR